MSDAQVQEMVLKGANMYTASSWLANTERLVQCLRLICTPADTKIAVKKIVQRDGEREEQTVMRHGTNGNYCYKDFS